jgi:hypothetical protein
MKFEVDVWIHLAQPRGGAFELGFPDPRFAVQDLALEVGCVHHIGIYQTEPADTGRREIEGGGRAEGAGADQQHRRVFKAQLSGLAHVGNEQVP